MIFQVKDCLKQNEDLRGILEKLRKEQASLVSMNDKDILRDLSEQAKDAVSQNGSETHKNEFLSLKVCLLQ